MAQTDSKAEARQHFEKGVAAFNDRRFGDAAAEFNAAYKLSPATVVLYNIGQVNVVLGQSVEAVEVFERYLAEGSTTIPSERRLYVMTEIEKQRSRIGVIAVRTQPPGADVRLNGRLVGKTPLGRMISVTAGKHTIEAQLAHHAPQVREVDVAGKSQVEIDFKLGPVPNLIADTWHTSRHAPIQRPPDPASELRVSPAGKVSAIETGGSSNWRRPSGFALGVLGLITVGTGAVLTLQGASAAKNAKIRLTSAANASMPMQKDLDDYDRALSDFNSAKSRNQVGWTMVGIGAGALIGGVLLLTSPAERPGRIGLHALAPSLTGSSAGMILEGTW